ncbi:DUF2309 domain-containing protein [Lacihabitans sp. CCS-44]|uniref:YbcC family protein n=1 Tax=Lacihabitans sp. CCS-44 TaxID=2487331 RepID=UPI0020CE011B|nr:DUF2309 domain-containing protein [Lacihabitans sp. CCS-44]MCP9755898.1 DUF2309 domain-containing protein [Lacihabitans sp. CCS-44]
MISKTDIAGFDEQHLLHQLAHYLPAQAPLKDFVHHNTLHGFQHLKFEDALRTARTIFGYKTSLSIKEFRSFYEEGKISESALFKVIVKEKGDENLGYWLDTLKNKYLDNNANERIGAVRNYWKEIYQIDLDSVIQPILFRLLCSYLDQGIAIWRFPIDKLGFLESLQELEKNGVSSIFKTSKIKKIFLDGNYTLSELLLNLVGDESLYEQYVFDQQFSHQGWSGMVSVIENLPETLLETRRISLLELIKLECLLELDAIEDKMGENWKPLSSTIIHKPTPLFSEIPLTEYFEAIHIWQKAFEWTYYDEVLNGLRENTKFENAEKVFEKTFQAMFCIDDRECSFRRYLELEDPNCETFGTPGFFGVEFFFKPIEGKFYTKVCPAPVTPKFLIKEDGLVRKMEKDAHFSKHSHNFISGWLIAQTLGFWSAFKLFLNIFKPSMGPMVSHSFKHMDSNSNLSIDHNFEFETDLQVGFKVEEMVDRVENVLKSIGLVKNFAPLVYVVGHGASSINNPHYAAYDCGACSGRAGSVNSRVFSYMANKSEVRRELSNRGILIPEGTRFIGGLRDTTRDEIMFYDEESLSESQKVLHKANLRKFSYASKSNSKERSRRFESINTKSTSDDIHHRILERSVSLFEPRPELNHATNALCIVGKRTLTKGLFLDRRSFLNSYDASIDPDGKRLLGILNAAVPVCGGINLEYYFSRVDNQKLGAGSKLPHNVMGLFGVANGIDGDLRPGLPNQMIEVHDPVRLLMVIEQNAAIVLDVIQRNNATYEWIKNGWVMMATIDPNTSEISVFEDEKMVSYSPPEVIIDGVINFDEVIESSMDNLRIFKYEN